MSVADGTAGVEKPKVSPLNDPKIRSLVFQGLLVAAVLLLIFMAISNADANLRKQGIARGLGFWDNPAGFPISQALIPYSEAISTYGRAFWVGLLNTLVIALTGIILATFLGFAIGIARLSKNWLVAQAAYWYVEIIRNLPLLLQLLFWYNAVLAALPPVRDAIGLPGGFYLSQRGLVAPEPDFLPGSEFVLFAFIAGLIGTIVYRRWAKKKQDATGEQSPVGWVTLGLLIGMPLVIFTALGGPIGFNFAEKGRFNIIGGVTVLPEFMALLFGLVIYTAAFIAEVVRAGIQAVYKGQTEAAFALGLRPGPTTKLIIIPQAMRVIIPPLTSQYLNLTKNSSLAVFIGYPDLVNVFTGTTLNQTGQAIEVVGITMLVYLTISLTTSLFMNWYNARKALVER